MKNNKKDENDTDAILAHIERFGVDDKDASSHKNKPKIRRTVHRTNKKEYRYKLDLHGLTSEEARRSVTITLENCRRQGIKEILIIHGIGYHSTNEGPVLKVLVRSMLEHELHHRIRDFKPAPFKDGGDGATIIYLA